MLSLEALTPGRLLANKWNLSEQSFWKFLSAKMVMVLVDTERCAMPRIVVGLHADLASDSHGRSCPRSSSKLRWHCFWSNARTSTS